MADADGLRCFGADDPLYRAYHDDEWGRPSATSAGCTSGSRWRRFSPGWRGSRSCASATTSAPRSPDFEPEAVAAFDDDDVARLMADAGIVRNRLKVDATINNARAVLGLRDAGTSLPELVWSHRPDPAAGAGRLGRCPGAHAGVHGAGQGAQARGLPVRRADHGVCRDAGLRAGQRPPRGVRRTGGDRGRAGRRLTACGWALDARLLDRGAGVDTVEVERCHRGGFTQRRHVR